MTDALQTPAPAPSTPPPATQTIDAPLHEVAFYDEQNERLAAESDPDSKALKALESMPAEDAAKEATKIQRRRRERAGVADPIVERKYAEPLKLDRDDEDATWEGTNTLRQASKDLSFSRLMDRGSALLNAGLSTQDALAVVNAELAQGKPSEQPLTKIGLANNDGTLVGQINDTDGPILGLDKGVALKNAREAAQAVGNFREVAAQQQQALLADLQQRETVQQQEAERHSRLPRPSTRSSLNRNVPRRRSRPKRPALNSRSAKPSCDLKGRRATRSDSGSTRRKSGTTGQAGRPR